MIEQKEEKQYCQFTGKRCYTEREAGATLNNLLKGRGMRSAKKKRNIPKRKYYCDKCGFYHLTHFRTPYIKHGRQGTMGNTDNSYFIREKKDHDYTVMNNTFLKDITLSWKAKGLFAYILSLPDNWKIHQNELITHGADGITAFRSAVKELKEHGYIKMNKKSINGRFIYEYLVIEKPESAIIEPLVVESIEEQIEQPKEEKPVEKREPRNEIEKVESAYLTNYKEMFEKGVLKCEKPIINWGQTRKLTRTRLDELGLDKVLMLIERSKHNDFCVSRGYSLSTILSAGIVTQLLNETETAKKQPQIVVEEKLPECKTCPDCGSTNVKWISNKNRFCGDCHYNIYFRGGKWICD